MQINLTVFSSSTTVINNNLRFIAYEAATPAVPVANVTYAPPQSFPKSVTLTVPNPVPHLVKIYTSPDTSIGTLLSDFLYDPTYQDVQIRPYDEIIIGSGVGYDPGAGATQIIIPDAVGWDYVFERRANGATQRADEYNKLPTGPQLTRPGDVFDSGEAVFIHYAPRTVTATPTFNYLNVYSDVIDVTVDTLIDQTYAGKLIQINSLADALVLTMDDVTLIPDMKVFTITTFMGAQKQSIISGPFKYRNQDMPNIYIGEQETAVFVKKGAYFYVETLPEGIFKVGRYFILDQKLGIPNMVYCDGGSLLIEDYPRLDYWLSQLPLGVVLSSLAARDALGLQGKPRWVRDVVNGLIYRPDKRGLFERALPDGRNDMTFSRPGTGALAIPSSFEPGGNKAHNHYTDSRFWNGVAMSITTNSQATPVIDNVSADKELRVGEMNQASNIAGKTWWDLSHFVNEGGSEALPNNWGGYIMVQV